MLARMRLSLALQLLILVRTMSDDSKPAIYVLDIETAPILAFVWGLIDQNIGLNQIHTDWSLLSFAAKRLDSKTVYYRDNRGQKDVRDDKELMTQLWKLLDEADVIVAQNGKQFDLKKINARFAVLGFPPPSPYRVVDTVQQARKSFGFTSNRLEWLSRKLTATKKSAHKKFPGFELWTECLSGNKLAWEEMRRYNIADVVATEELYLKLRPWITPHPNVATYSASTQVTCPKCGSVEVQRRGTEYRDHGTYHRIRCSACHGWSRGPTNLLTKEKKKCLLS
jgi:predicted RNA-binding Zn-ribbon protein involved in translation (DUF1610 family)